MNKTHILPALCAGFFMSAQVVSAAVQTLPTPSPNGHIDTESGTNISLVAWRAFEPRTALTLALDATPSNAVQVAFGHDRYGDADLAPEETEFVLGCDCGTWFTRDERTGEVTLTDTPTTPNNPNNTSNPSNP